MTAALERLGEKRTRLRRSQGVAGVGALAPTGSPVRGEWPKRGAGSSHHFERLRSQPRRGQPPSFR